MATSVLNRLYTTERRSLRHARVTRTICEQTLTAFLGSAVELDGAVQAVEASHAKLYEEWRRFELVSETSRAKIHEFEIRKKRVVKGNIKARNKVRKAHERRRGEEQVKQAEKRTACLNEIRRCNRMLESLWQGLSDEEAVLVQAAEAYVCAITQLCACRDDFDQKMCEYELAHAAYDNAIKAHAAASESFEEASRQKRHRSSRARVCRATTSAR